ncbi:hypothetical protein TbgDal_IX9950 [Trypanosoma brucei gambiense DAL972]|uniref:Uncharacterized protein n=1 Tax=Trypanosoma brucei gambiense (strain MHOM/CI/86/DAL972) TaxID=679716 RepID=C9ZZS0_TRYB9|nr:hypothetical protein TbgDal_IX9950 [Trypanosoma brucei gambiense DAL972]CBH14919.1 hypothetical protein TbgDal_IX9950 [Trypanosoma brucei gambiense DAL972]|eukprot:XP_011777185.1 hypothetical protein TbgDal_IX9950 [Trypanosoma brucei gambiense DAL972]
MFIKNTKMKEDSRTTSISRYSSGHIITTYDKSLSPVHLLESSTVPTRQLQVHKRGKWHKVEDAPMQQPQTDVTYAMQRKKKTSASLMEQGTLLVQTNTGRKKKKQCTNSIIHTKQKLNTKCKTYIKPPKLMTG